MPEPTRFAEKLSAPEGPVVGPNGWVLNVCSFTLTDRDWPYRGGDITATHLSRPLHTHAVFNTSTPAVVGIPAALAFGPDGCLYVTDEGRRSIVRVAPDGTQTDFIAAYDGERLNGPNDLSFDLDGNLYFTDPWTSSVENPIGGIYGYEWATGQLSRIRSGMAFPNGIVVSGRRLYVAETMTRKVWLFQVTGPGRAGGQTEFCTLPEMQITDWQGGDGMALDAEGNLYVTQLAAGCIRVYDPDGNLTVSIRTGGLRPTNVCFGGPKLDTLYVTIDDLQILLHHGDSRNARESPVEASRSALRSFLHHSSSDYNARNSIGALVSIPIGVPGYRLPFCPSRSKDHLWSRMLPPVPE